MKRLLLLVCCFSYVAVMGQVEGLTPDSLAYFNSYSKALIGLKDQTVLRVNQITTHNSDVTVEYNPKKTPLHPIYNIRVENIKYISFRRNAFVKGMLAGASLGLLILKLAIQGNDDPGASRNAGYVLLGTIPLTVTGGILGSIFIKKTFRINGDKQKLFKIMKRM